MRSIFLVVFLLAGLTLLAACGGAAAPSPTPAQAGPKVSLTTNPNPPRSGEVELMVTVNDANGQPIPDADVFVFADHTEMKGMNMNGRATPQGGGRYTIAANFGMSGPWKVTVQVKKAPLDVAEEFNLEFQ
ncbi:MAG: FixH family protein [Anaerolineae bacterium]|nr:FixH family protein [Anaerolineae bacterium]